VILNRPTTTEILDKQGFVPLYHQIQLALLERINRGDLKEGDLLESEEELSRRYRVSRMTARQALQSLKLKGYAISERGRGTFVTKPKLDKSIMQLRSFTEELRKTGITPSSRLLEQKVVQAKSELAEILKLEAGENVLHLRRLRLANKVPLAVEDSHILLSRFPGLDQIDFSNRSLYQTIRDRYSIQFGWADEVIEALPATKEEAELLSVTRRSSLLCISRTLMASDETPLEFAISHYRGDRYRASLRVPMIDAE
jgi:GntR family transcriptional regulator